MPKWERNDFCLGGIVSLRDGTWHFPLVKLKNTLSPAKPMQKLECEAVHCNFCGNEQAM